VNIYVPYSAHASRVITSLEDILSKNRAPIVGSGSFPSATAERLESPNEYFALCTNPLMRDAVLAVSPKYYTPTEKHLLLHYFLFSEHCAWQYDSLLGPMEHDDVDEILSSPDGSVEQFKRVLSEISAQRSLPPLNSYVLEL